MNLPNMLLIGAIEKNSGKTGLSEKIIQQFSKQHQLYAVKATVLRNFEGRKGFTIFEETNPDRQKDTGRLLTAGSRKVFWLKTDEEHAEQGIREVLQKIPENAPVLCESNTIRKYITPGIFLMVQREYPVGSKKTASEVKKFVDRFITSKKVNSKIIYEPDILKLLILSNNQWQLVDM